MKKIILPLLILIVIGGIYYYRTINYISPVKDLTIPFEIKSGESSLEIAKNLEAKQLIKNIYVFEIYVLLTGISDNFQAGQHYLTGNQTLKDYVRALTEAVAKDEISITIIEGWDNIQIAQYLEDRKIAKKEEFLNVTQKEFKEFESRYDFLNDKPEGQGLLGYLFPDTYRIYRNASVRDIIDKMLSNFGRKLSLNLREKIAGEGKTIYDIIILASILEKEVSTYDDQRWVADIFYKRLKAGIPLQADSTINFITKKGTDRASLEDTKIDNPYNTYKYKGLPPGPICNPGLSSIKAAISPLKNDYWYFLTTNDGKVIYSKTYQEHLKNKAKYLK